MSRKAKEIRRSVWLCLALAGIALAQIAYYGFVQGEWIAILFLAPGVLAGVVMAWWLPRGLARFGEQHWLFISWRTLWQKLRR